jgi:mRNA interferase MazF
VVRREIQRGELWEADLDPTVGHEQGGRRPVLILSIDPMNKAPAEMVLAVALTTTPRENLFHVRLEPHESGLPRVSYAMPEMVRMLSHERLRRPIGHAPEDKVDKAANNVGVLLGLGRSR